VIDPVELLEELVRIDSVNPAMGGPGEHEIMARLVEILRDLGLEVSTPEVGDGRRNLLATLPGTSSAPTLLLEAHLDTVAMPEDGLAVSRTEDRVVGRGSCDTKGSAAAMVAAMAELMGSGEERATMVFAGVADEEDRMVGSRALVDQLPPIDAAVIGEPTSLEPVRVHNGLARIIIETHGQAAHTSRAHLGVNAISAAARVVSGLEEHLLPRLKARAHPLAGPALLTPAVIGGGVAPNVVPDRCRLWVDRRLAPGEDPDAALAEIDQLLEGLRERGDRITRKPPWVLLEAVETPADHPVVRLAEESVKAVLGRPVTAGGVPYGTDASNLSGVGGVPCVVLGPGSIDQAHTDDEWVPVEEVRRAAVVYAEMARRFVRHRAEGGSAR
jgi:acetylornithine deacetylase/succinyl-diaminopimelate desuccinylase-like protein